MARLYPETLEDFKETVDKNCTPSTHMAYTDFATYVVVFPIVTSQHRHYIVFKDVTEEDIKKAIDYLKKKGITVAKGRVELLQA